MVAVESNSDGVLGIEELSVYRLQLLQYVGEGYVGCTRARQVQLDLCVRAGLILGEDRLQISEVPTEGGRVAVLFSVCSKSVPLVHELPGSDNAVPVIVCLLTLARAGSSHDCAGNELDEQRVVWVE
jgi:hypothetical protein